MNCKWTLDYVSGNLNVKTEEMSSTVKYPLYAFLKKGFLN